MFIVVIRTGPVHSAKCEYVRRTRHSYTLAAKCGCYVSYSLVIAHFTKSIASPYPGFPSGWDWDGEGGVAENYHATMHVQLTPVIFRLQNHLIEIFP